MKPDHLKNLWDMMKGLNNFSGYEDYDSWKKAKYQLDEKKVEFEKWKENLLEKEQSDFDLIFNEKKQKQNQQTAEGQPES